jgi:hypothetical protein
MFFIAAITSGAELSWPDVVDFFGDLAKPTAGLARRKNARTMQIQFALPGRLLFIIPTSALDFDIAQPFYTFT